MCSNRPHNLQKEIAEEQRKKHANSIGIDLCVVRVLKPSVDANNYTPYNIQYIEVNWRAEFFFSLATNQLKFNVNVGQNSDFSVLFMKKIVC